MTIWMVFALLVVIYLERKTIDRIGQSIMARIKFEARYWSIRRSLRKHEGDWR